MRTKSEPRANKKTAINPTACQSRCASSHNPPPPINHQKGFAVWYGVINDGPRPEPQPEITFLCRNAVSYI